MVIAMRCIDSILVMIGWLSSYRVVNRTWEIVNTKGEAPSGRSRSRAVVYKDRMYLLGGFNMQRRSSLGDFYEFNFVNNISTFD